MFRILVIVVLICGTILTAHGQDSTKKIKPFVKNKTYKYHTYKYHAKADSAASKIAYTKPDTAFATAPVLTDKSLNGQYQYLLSKIYHYQQPLVSALWKNAFDTLNFNRNKLNAAQNKLSIQNKTIDSLTAGLNKNEALLSTVKAGEIDILGFPVSKTIYNLVMWGLILLFGTTAVVVIARSGGYSREAKYRAGLYTELEDEFKAYKIKANDKEKKLARELQTERNKLDDLLGKR